MGERALLSTDYKEFPLFRRGKVRDVYDLGGRLLVVSTDRISCFDVVLKEGIPGKGKVLTAVSLFWFSFLAGTVKHHFLSADVSGYPQSLGRYAQELSGRSMLVKKTKPLPVECIVRGYLSGSGWKEYKKSGSICGVRLPAGLRESEKLPFPIFTPSTKAESGHDENVSVDYVRKMLGEKTACSLEEMSLSIYRRAEAYAAARGIIIADTKFEFGLDGEEIILIDEVLTPDSSRFWPADMYKPGGPQPSFDKQFVRDYLEGLDWDKTPSSVPSLPLCIIEKTGLKYLEACSRLTGMVIDL
ncbi:MAG: phosphoribosylaminoimidazolesuccinocarboxamide synthase [Candidatus Omnitrophota bacterium]|jgi:phosphoribosylaminoimidazole-succinocarboxamide synthase